MVDVEYTTKTITVTKGTDVANQTANASVAGTVQGVSIQKISENTTTVTFLLFIVHLGA